MSHFTTLTVHKIGQDPEEILKPFDENLETPRYVEYTKVQLIEKGKKEIENYKNGTYDEYLKNPIKYESESKNPGHINYVKNEFPKKLNWTDEEIYKDQIERYEPENIGKDGEVYSIYNPQSKWDWYSMGGRWTGYFKLKKGGVGTAGSPGLMTKEAKDGYVDMARFSDIDWDGMLIESRNDAEKSWEKFQEELKKDENYALLSWDIRDKNITKEQFLEDQIRIAPFAFIDKEGKWNEKGSMGWWGIVTNEDKKNYEKAFAKFLKTLEPDDILTIWDLHI